MTSNAYIKTYDYSIRIVMLGDCCVGKTSFTKKLDKRKDFCVVYEPTIGVDYSSQIIEMPDDITVKCQIWDTAGQEKFVSIIRSYFNGVAGIIVMFDLSRRSTFNHLDFWFDEIKRNKENYPISVMLIGNKLDNKYREISTEEAKHYAKSKQALYGEISVKTGENIHKVLKTLSEHIMNIKEENKGVKKIEGIKIRLKEKKNRNTDCCCCM